MADSTAKLREEILALSGVDIMLNANEFKSTYQIMEELADKWEHLTDIQQASVTELIAGKRQGNIVSSLMNNFDIAEQALETSLNSAGSAMKEHEKWQQSLEAQILSLKASWQGLSQAFLSSDFLKVVLDGVIGLVDGLTKLIDTFGAFPTLMGTVATGMSIFKNTGFISILNKDVADAQKQLSLFGKSFKNIQRDMQSGQNLFTSFFSKSITKNDVSCITNFMNQIKSGVPVGKAWSSTMTNASVAGKKMAVGVKAGTVSINALKTATIGGKAALLGLKVAATAANIALTMGLSFAIQLAIEGIMKLVNAKKELAEKIEEVTSKYEEEHNSLMKLKGDYDASNEDSMVSKYKELSKGVNALGENVSLTADEYSEYQSIVETIANQMPNLVTGYNSQGDAILSCKGNVEELTEAYKNLIKEQNSEVLDTGADIFKDFKNDLEETTAYYKKVISDDGLNEYAEQYNTDHFEKLKSLITLTGGDKDIESLVNELSHDDVTRISGLLDEYGIERNLLGSGEAGWETQREHIIRALNDDKAKIKNILKDASADLNAYAEDMATVTEAYFSTAFLGGDGSDIGDYSHISERMQNIINQITSGFGSEFYDDFLKEDDPFTALTEYYDKMLAVFDGLSDSNAEKVETAFDLKTKFNGGEISYGEYIDGIQNVEKLIDDLGLEEEVETQLKLSLGLSEKDGKWIIEEYETLLNRLTSDKHEIQLDTESAKSFIRDLDSEELKVAIDFIDSGNKDFNSVLQNYKDVFKEAEKAGVDFSKTVYGNIDTNARKTLEWTSENLEKYKDELMSFEPKDAKWEDVKKGFEGSISTVMGAWDTFKIDGKEVDIAFSPMLQTDNGAELLSSGTVNTYINNLIEKATEDGKWNNEELFKLDAEGIEVDGKKISGILADIGDKAYQTAEQMHFVGKNGALALADAELMALVEEQARINKALNFNPDIEVDTTALETFNEILAESASAMGLSSDAIDSLKSKYSDLDGYDAGKLFERTANGVKVNRQELDKLEKEYNDLTKSEVQEHIDTLTEAYNDNVIAIDKCSNAAERARLISDNETYKNQIEELATYQAQLEGVTGAYQKWLNAQDTPEDYEGYELVATSREDIQDEIDRGFIGNATKEYIDLLSGEDLDGKSIDDYANAWEELDKKVTGAGYSVNDFFTVNDDGDITAKGIDRFFKSLQTDFKGSVAKFNDETKEWTYDFGSENLEKIQEKWGIGIEAIELLLEAAASAGYDIDWDGILDGIDLDTSNFETLVSTAESAQTAFNNLKGIDDVDFNFTCTGVEQATSELEKARSTYIDLITNDDGTINLNAEGAEQMRVILATLLIQKQQLEDSDIAINIDTSGLDESQQDIANAINAVKTFREKYKNLEIAVTTGQGIEEAKTELNTAMTELQGLGDAGVDIAAELILGEGASAEDLNGKIDAAISAVGKKDIKVGCKLDETAIGTLNSQVLANFTPEATVKITDIDDTLVGQYTSTEKTAEGTVKWKNDDKLVVSYSKIKKTATGTVNWGNNTKDVKTSFSATGTVNWTSGNNVKVNVVSEANGTANADGTARSGRAFAKGNWGINGSGTALVGELGMETLVRNGRFYTIGDNCAEFVKYQQGDIIFNHKQTEELFKNGKVTSGGGRGKMFVNGSAYADGSYPSSGRAFWEATASTSSWAQNRATGQSYGSKDTGKDKDNDFEEVLDWIEVIIDRVERSIDRFDQQANNIYKSWSSRNSALQSQISEVNKEINLQQQAYNKYISAANGVGLSSSWAAKVRDGAIDINTIKDEALADKIKSYQDYFNKALDCKDAIEELREAESKLYTQRVENVATQYEGVLGVIEHEKNIIEEYISQSKANAWFVSESYYDALKANEEQTISELKSQQDKMLEAFNAAMDSGTIVKGSEAYYDMVNSIDEVTLAIQESQTAIEEYNQTIEQLKWEQFDLLQDKISAVTDETEFLIELMSSDKLFDDNGQLTDKGSATMGLHGVAYNTYMYQADQAKIKAEELKTQLDAELEKGILDTELEERYREMVSLQQEYILAAQGEKEAIRDLVEEGIDYELEALQEKIDLYNEELESAEDLYQYNKKIQEQTSDIASLEKQLAAYSGDNSEEARAKVQELKISLKDAKSDLEDSERDWDISSQQKLLDELYDDYELTLNTRLDNLDALVGQMIDEINADAGIISDTISEVIGNVNYELSESMSAIWDKNSVETNNVIASYGDKIEFAQTTTNGALTLINNNLLEVIGKLDSKAQTNVKKATTSSSSNSTTTKKTTTTTKKSVSGGDGTPKVGDKVKFVNGQYYYDSYGMKPLGSQKQGQYVYITNINKKGSHPYHISTGTKLGSGDLGWLKLNQISGYATGKQNFVKDEIAWTQENGREFIVRPSDGAILTPVAKNDSVLNASASNNIWDMANNPADFIKNNLNLGAANVPNDSNVNNSIVQNFENITFSMPNVHGYNDLLTEMQRDPKFEKLILSMTIDQIAGKSKLAKGKSIR